MPGPRNRPRKRDKKRAKKAPNPSPTAARVEESSDRANSPLSDAPPPLERDESKPDADTSPPSPQPARNPLHKSYLDPSGSGEKLEGVWDFLQTPYAEPPALHDVRFAPFARHDILDVLRTYLPEELALTVWYNKSRKVGRICAACRRFYKLGDILPPLGPGDQTRHEDDPRCLQERRISGLCTLTCFGAATFNTPGMVGAWGKVESQLDAQTAWTINHPPPPVVDDEGMGSLFRLTRLADVGVGHYVTIVHQHGDLAE